MVELLLSNSAIGEPIDTLLSFKAKCKTELLLLNTLHNGEMLYLQKVCRSGESITRGSKQTTNYENTLLKGCKARDSFTCRE